MSILQKKLSDTEKEELLDLVGLEEIEGVIYYHEGEEFFGVTENDKYDFSTLGGFLEYFKDESIKEGKQTLKREFKMLLSL